MKKYTFLEAVKAAVVIGEFGNLDIRRIRATQGTAFRCWMKYHTTDAQWRSEYGTNLRKPDKEEQVMKIWEVEPEEVRIDVTLEKNSQGIWIEWKSKDEKECSSVNIKNSDRDFLIEEFEVWLSKEQAPKPAPVYVYGVRCKATGRGMIAAREPVEKGGTWQTPGVWLNLPDNVDIELKEDKVKKFKLVEVDE
jgi:hypothetical protein